MIAAPGATIVVEPGATMVVEPGATMVVAPGATTIVAPDKLILHSCCSARRSKFCCTLVYLSLLAAYVMQIQIHIKTITPS